MAASAVAKFLAKLGIKTGAKTGAKTGSKIATKLGFRGGALLGGATVAGLHATLSQKIGIPSLPGGVPLWALMLLAGGAVLFLTLRGR